MRILVAFDKFKGSLTAREACTLAREELETLGHTVIEAPLTDGGDGFAELLTHALHGETIRLAVHGPLGDLHESSYGIVRAVDIPAEARALAQLPDAGDVALVDIASSSGLVHVPAAQRDPWKTTTRGLGELIADAIQRKVSAIIVGLGGSATNDLALGALSALGLRFVMEGGHTEDHVVPARWEEVMGFEGRLRGKYPELRLACDVTNPLLGPRGAVHVFAPQKGLRALDAARMENETERMAEMLADHFGADSMLVEAPGAGAAGGAGYGLRVALGARLVPGFDLVSAWLQILKALEECDLLMTGEGRFDASSLEGKGPGRLLQAAQGHGVRTLVLAGSVDPHAAGQVLAKHGADFIRAIAPPDQDPETAMHRAAGNLRRAVQEAMRLLS
jgi:glycerate kinase